MTTASNTLTDLLAQILGTTPEQIQAHIQAKQAAARRRIAANNARYEQALRAMTDTQSCVVDSLVAKGNRLQSEIWINKSTRNIALMLTMQCWNSMKGRMGIKITMVYPDGTTNSTFEKTISLRKEF